MNHRIASLFKRKSSRILSVYFTAGFPQKDATLPVLEALQEGGIDLVEIGIPFSDPMADGPVIQHSSQTALQNGMSLNVLFTQLSALRPAIHIPVLLMGYVNVIMQFGLEPFCQACRQVGIDGIILPDLPLDEYLSMYKPVMDAHGLAMVLLITPETSEERVRIIDKHTDSFIYMVSSASVTGTQTSFDEQKLAYFRRIEAMSLRNPCLIGFGISNKTTVKAAWAHASGAIIGSRFIGCLEQTDSPAAAVDCLLASLQD